MTPTKTKPAAGTAGSKENLSLTRIDNPKYSPPPHLPQAKSSVVDAAHRFRRAQGEIRLVRIAVADGRAPIGRSRAFKIHPRDVAHLLCFAEQLEANRC
jgi:hypothetical protein